MEDIKEKTADEMIGRRNGKTIELAMRLREYILKLPECKLYGIKNCKNNIILLTNEEVILKSKIKQIRDKAECMDYYCLNDVIDDLNKLLGDE